MRTKSHISLAAIFALTFALPATGDETVTQVESSSRMSIQMDDVNYRFSFALPTRQAIEHALPSAEGDRVIDEIVCELISTNRGTQRFFPQVGSACIVSSRFLCTVRSNQGTEVVYLDYDVLERAD